MTERHSDRLCFLRRAVHDGPLASRYAARRTAGHRVTAALAGVVIFAFCGVVQVDGQSPPPPETRPEAARVTVSWKETPIRDVLLAFAAFSGRSIVPGAGVTGTVTADINDQPWDLALESILAGHGLVAVESEHGIIRVDDLATVSAREQIEPLVTRTYRISFVDAEEIRATLAPLLSPRGAISVAASTNTVVVTDVPRVHRAIAGLVRVP